MTLPHPSSENVHPDPAAGHAWPDDSEQGLSAMLDALGDADRARTPEGLAARVGSAAAEAAARKARPQPLAFERKPSASRNRGILVTLSGLALAAALALIAVIGPGWLGTSPRSHTPFGEEQTLASVDQELEDWLDALEETSDLWDLAVGSTSVEDDDLLSNDLWSVDDPFLTEEVVF